MWCRWGSAPRLIHSAFVDDAAILVLADVGRVNLEQEPTFEGFLAAAEILASVRSKPVEGPSGFTSARLIELVEPIDAGLGAELVEKVAPALDELHREAPLAVVHGDFVPKNLVTDGTHWTAVDWPLAYLAPHLSDLYTLVRDAVAYGHQAEPVVARFVDASGTDPELVSRQLSAKRDVLHPERAELDPQRGPPHRAIHPGMDRPTPRRTCRGHPMKLLILGGTKNLGRHVGRRDRHVWLPHR